MPSDLAQELQQAHALLDRLPPDLLSAVRGLMETMLDPISGKLAAAPIDDEPETEEERLAIAKAKEWLKHNRAIPMEEVLAEFGLTMDDFRKMGQTPLPNGQED